MEIVRLRKDKKKITCSVILTNSSARESRMDSREAWGQISHESERNVNKVKKPYIDRANSTYFFIPTLFLSSPFLFLFFPSITPSPFQSKKFLKNYKKIKNKTIPIETYKMQVHPPFDEGQLQKNLASCFS